LEILSMAEAVANIELPETRVEGSTWILDRVRDLGLTPEPGTRLVEMHRVLSRGYVPYEDPDFPIALESMRDLHQLIFGLSRMWGGLGTPGFRELVQHLINDRPLPQDDFLNSPGRDKQFELYLAAICHNAGLRPVDYEEPDVTCFIEGTKFGIAAKRIKSRTPSQLKKHIVKAATQLRDQGLPGIIALELTLRRNPTNRAVTSSLESQMYFMISGAKNRQFREEYGERIREWVKGSDVKAVMVLESTLRLLPSRQWWHDGMLSWVPVSFDDDHEDPLFEAFYKQFLDGVPSLDKSE
jgi:hypothetical protein